MAEIDIQRAALLGTGVIGAGWAARLIHHGVAVTAYDPDPGAEARLRDGLDGALAALARLTDGRPPTGAKLDFTTDLTAAVADADLIQENAPERLDLKKDLLVAAGAVAKPDALIASSTSGYRPSQLQDGVAHPERVLVAHPFNPVYLLPLVELVGGAETDPAMIAGAADFYRRIGMHPDRAARNRWSLVRPPAGGRGARRCIWSMTASRPPMNWTRRLSTARACGGP